MSYTVLGFDFPPNTRVWKICAALKCIGESYEFKGLDFGKSYKTEDFLNNCHPLGRTPVLQTTEGYLFESAAILRHIARVGAAKPDGVHLYGASTFQSSQVDAWLDFVSTELSQHAGTFVHNVISPVGDEAIAKATETLHTAFKGLERHMSIRSYLVGERISVADIHFAFEMDWLYRFCPTADDFKQYKNTYRLYNTVMNQPWAVDALKAHGAPIGFPKAEKKKEEPKKEEPKKPKKEVPQLEVEEPKKKEANPLDLLPASTFVLDAFKREYSNKETREEALPYLFQNFDPEGFTYFWCDYLYPEDLSKMLFMTCNLVGGWMQRMDHMRKYAFGSILIVGAEDKQQITGLWIFRGKGWPKCLDDVVDTELYKWTEITDIEKEKERICDYFAWDGETFKDNKVLNARIFK